MPMESERSSWRVTYEGLCNERKRVEMRFRSSLEQPRERAVMLVNFSQLMNARWLHRLSDLSQRHRTSLKYHHRLGLFPETA
jgi:hypothetical protein